MSISDGDIKIFVAHASSSDGGKDLAMCTKLINAVSGAAKIGALGDKKVEIKSSSGAKPGTELRAREKFATHADVLVFIFSVEFFVDSLCIDLFEGRGAAQSNHGQVQIGIHLTACGIGKYAAVDNVSLHPKDGKPLSGGTITSDIMLESVVNEIVESIKDRYPPPPPIPPAELRSQKQWLKQALESLNYKDQPDGFEMAISASNRLPTAFLLHGRLPSSGDRWLKSKLIGRLGVDNIIFIDIVLGVAERERDDTVNVFLKPMAEFFGPKKGVINNERIFSKVYDALLDNDFTYVIQISEASDLLMGSESKDFEQFIAEFWNPLNQVLKTGDGNHCGQLILFFVVEQSAEECSHFSPFCDGYDALNPLRLNAVDPLNEELVSKWIAQKAHHFSKLPKRPTQILEQTTRAEAISQLLQECDNGLPEKVLESICNQCGFQLSDILNININEAQN